MTDGLTGLVLLYDERCRFCLRCRDWLARQRTHVPLELLAAGSPRAQAWAGHLPLGGELVVLGSDGSAWVGDDAFLVCLWATVAHRGWALRLADHPQLSRTVLRGLSSGRWLLGEEQPCDEDQCEGEARAGADERDPR